jgi:CheY-like chemotaxis protein
MALIVAAEDDVESRSLMAHALRSAGHAVLEAVDGAHALELVREHRPQLLITDHVMPRLTGIALCRELMREEDTRAIPVILVSGRIGTESVRAQLPHIGAVLPKPFRPGTLVTLTEILLRDPPPDIGLPA